MPDRRPDLIVPIRDRRQHKRYLTLKNFFFASMAFLVLFAVITIRSEMRGLKPGGYGRLFDREVPVEVKPLPVEVVEEAPPPVEDATHPDPMLIEPAARAQWLEDENAAAIVAATAAEPARASSSDSNVTIVGGTEGVTVVRKERKRPVLSGGFGRQPN